MFNDVSASSPSSPSPRFTRELPHKVEALDGLRGIAILIVVCSHFRSIVSDDPYFDQVTPWVFVNTLFSRGFLGVDLFFVLSGFLITSLLFKIDVQKPKRSFGQFYMRRVLRLFPALFVLLLASFIISYFEKFSMSDQWKSTWPALLFVSNWNLQWNFFHFQSDIGHLWSLAVEEQFYIIWPSILLLHRMFRKSQWILSIAVTSMIIWIIFHRIDLLNSRKPWLFLYSQTDTRIDSMLVGCLAALFYRYVNLRPAIIKYAGFIAFLLVLPIAYQFADYKKDFLYRGGFTVIAILLAIIVLASVSREPSPRSFLELPILQWFGKVSYGLYLWHAFIFRVAERHFHFGSNSLRIALVTIFSLLVTQFSWKYIEQPFLKLKDRRFQDSSKLSFDKAKDFSRID